MAKPRQSTKDRWLDEFADFDLESQEFLLDTCELIHRQAKRREARRSDTTSPSAASDAQPAATLLDSQSEGESIR